ncbi:MAG: hypothetical protein ACI9U2_003183 [Bradymonadia bacterium]|jgi:hypothetical protein
MSSAATKAPQLQWIFWVSRPLAFVEDALVAGTVTRLERRDNRFPCAGESDYPASDQALELGLHLASSFLADLSIYGALDTQFAPFPVDDLPAELSRMVLAYCRCA